MNPRMQKPTRALIAGGGIAGLSLGFWLEKMGLNPVVIDRVDRFLPLGHYITLKGNGVDMLRQMGLLNQARTRESGFKQVIIFDAFGRALRKGSTAEFDQTLGGYIALRRSDLHAVLFEAVQGKFEIRYGIEPTAVHQAEDHISVEFSTGK